MSKNPESLTTRGRSINKSNLFKKTKDIFFYLPKEQQNIVTVERTSKLWRSFKVSNSRLVRFGLVKKVQAGCYSLCPCLNVVSGVRAISLTRFVENTCNIFIFK
jgi:hypothetical protein